MSKPRILLIEDDDLSANVWTSELQEAGLRCEWYETLMDGCLAKLNVAGVIFDVGSIGLMQDDQTYLSAYHQLRDFYPDVPIWLVSGMPHLPTMIREELPADKMIYPITGHAFYNECVDSIKEVLAL